MRLLALSWLALCVCSVSVRAQSVSASLTGLVTDARDAPVANALVQASSSHTGQVRTARTSAQGRYRIASLEPGRWEVVVEAPDGNRSAVQFVQLSLQQTFRLDVKVLAGVTEEVTVTAAPGQLDTTRTVGELRIDRTKTDELPVNGRVLTDLATLDSSVVTTAPGALFGERAAAFVVSGQSGRANAFLVDGFDNGDRTSSTTLNSFFSQQVIDEFVVMTRQFDAEFGRAAGGVLNIVTRRGGNDAAGEVLLQGTRSGWNSAGEFIETLPADGQNRVERSAVGLNFSGPLAKDKSFYFLSFEQQQADETTPFTGVQRDGTAGGLLLAPFQDTNAFLRTDFNLSEKNFLMARASWDKRQSNGLTVGGVITPEAGFRLDEEDSQIALSLKSILSPQVINEVRLLVGRSEFEQSAISGRIGTSRPSGIYGGSPLNRQQRDEDRVQLVQNTTFLTGPHAVKIGLDVLHTSTNASTIFNENGGFLYYSDAPFEPGDCGDISFFQVQESLQPNGEVACPGREGVDDDGDGTIDEPANVLTYATAYTLIDGAPRVDLSDTQYALFVQDSWQANPALVVNYGLRYDVSTFELPPETIVPSAIPNGGAKRDNDNIAPRFAVTYRPGGTGGTLFRAGAGVFYDKIPLAFPAVSDVMAGVRVGMRFPMGETIELTEALVEELGIDFIRQALLFPEEFTLRFSTATQLHTPYVMQYTAGVEQALSKHSVLRFEAERTLGYKQVRMRDLNPVIGIERLREEPEFRRIPLGLPTHRDTTVGSIAAIVTDGRSWYTGLTAGYGWNRGDRWLSASYTWSRAIDTAPDPLKGGIYLPPNSDDLLSEEGRADHDRRHRVVLSGEVPLFAGFRVSGVAQFASGAPFNVTTGRDENIDGFTTDRPAGVGRNTGEDTPLEAINDIRAFENLPLIGSLNEPDYLQVDVRLTRPIAIAGFEGGFFMQVFNVFDRYNPAVVEGRVASANFGQPYGLAGPPRTLELGLRLGF